MILIIVTLGELKCSVLPRLERVLERSMMVCLLGLLRTERLAREMSAVTRVMDILKQRSGAAAVTRLVNRNLFKLKPTSYTFHILPALKLVFQKVKERFLHHVCHLNKKEQQA